MQINTSNFGSAASVKLQLMLFPVIPVLLAGLILLVIGVITRQLIKQNQLRF
jgi:hypothetical protein